MVGHAKQVTEKSA